MPNCSANALWVMVGSALIILNALSLASSWKFSDRLLIMCRLRHSYCTASQVRGTVGCDPGKHRHWWSWRSQMNRYGSLEIAQADSAEPPVLGTGRRQFQRPDLATDFAAPHKLLDLALCAPHTRYGYVPRYLANAGTSFVGAEHAHLVFSAGEAECGSGCEAQSRAPRLPDISANGAENDRATRQADRTASSILYRLYLRCLPGCICSLVAGKLDLWRLAPGKVR